MKKNTAKSLLAQGKPAIGLMCGSASPLVAENLGDAGYDFVILDMQHGEITMADMQHMLRAVGSTNATPVVRIPSNMPVYIQRVLDMGAYGVIAPQVNSVADADRVVKAVRYAPRGDRSWGPFRASLCAGAGYFDGTRDELLTLVMIESAEALENAEAILAVDGVDGCFIGPVDLAISLGIAPDDPQLQEKIEPSVAAVLAAARKTGKIAGMHLFSIAEAERRIAQGFAFASVMSDVRMVRMVAGQVLTALKKGSSR